MPMPAKSSSKGINVRKMRRRRVSVMPSIVVYVAMRFLDVLAEGSRFENATAINRGMQLDLLAFDRATCTDERAVCNVRGGTGQCGNCLKMRPVRRFGA